MRMSYRLPFRISVLFSSAVFRPSSIELVFSASTSCEMPLTTCEMPAFSPCWNDRYVVASWPSFRLGLITSAGWFLRNGCACTGLNSTPTLVWRIDLAAATCFCCAADRPL